MGARAWAAAVEPLGSQLAGSVRLPRAPPPRDGRVVLGGRRDRPSALAAAAQRGRPLDASSRMASRPRPLRCVALGTIGGPCWAALFRSRGGGPLESGAETKDSKAPPPGLALPHFSIRLPDVELPHRRKSGEERDKLHRLVICASPRALPRRQAARARAHTPHPGHGLMAATSRKPAAAAASAVAPRRVLEMMKEATGASDEDICVMLQLCGGDANEATTKLLESEASIRARGLGRGRRGGGGRGRERSRPRACYSDARALCAIDGSRPAPASPGPPTPGDPPPTGDRGRASPTAPCRPPANRACCASLSSPPLSPASLPQIPSSA